MKDKTILTHYSENPAEYQGAIVPPIFQNSLFAFPDFDAIDQAFDDPANQCIYSRGKNPTVALVEEKLAKLAGGEKAKLFASGMGAISSAIMHYISANDHIIAVKNTYGPANNFMGTYLAEKMNVSVTYVLGKSIADFESAILSNTRLIYLESPSSAIMSLQDIEAVTHLAKSKGIKTIIDNTWATPIFQKPLKMGVDLEVHSCSKYLGGHSDIVAGVVIGQAIDIESIFLTEAALYGAKMSPFEAWLLLRSLRTLKIRVKEHELSTQQIVDFLDQHHLVKNVYHPYSKHYDQKDLAQKQMTGTTGLLAFEVDCEDLSKIKAFLKALTYFSIGVSWGGHESLVYIPAISYLKELSPDKFKAMGISLGTIRMSIGLEDVEDLIEDLDQAMRHLA